MTKQLGWCLSPLPVLKALQIAFSLLTILFLIDGRVQWFFYTVVYINAFLFVLFNLVSLFVLYFDVHRSQSSLPWPSIELALNAAGVLVHTVLAVVLAWDEWRMQSGEFHHHRYSPPNNIGKDGWKHRVLVVLVASVVQILLFVASLVRVKRSGIV